MKNIIRTYNPTVKFSKFTFNIKIYKKSKGFLSKPERKFVQKIHNKHKCEPFKSIFKRLTSFKNEVTT